MWLPTQLICNRKGSSSSLSLLATKLGIKKVYCIRGTILLVLTAPPKTQSRPWVQERRKDER